jgi:hypothetical protein
MSLSLSLFLPNDTHGILADKTCCIVYILPVQVLDYAIDLRTQSRPGKEIASPYEITLTEALHDFWQASFHTQDRIHTSTPFAR